MKPTQELIEWLESKAETKKMYLNQYEEIHKVSNDSGYIKELRIYNELLLLIEALKTKTK